MIETKDGVDGKVCPHCGSWKPLADFPNDSSHGDSQGKKHCWCKKCMNDAATQRNKL